MRILFTVFLSVVSFISFSQVEFSHDSWEEVLAKAKKENKPIFVDVYTDWCGPCKMMMKTTFQDSSVSKQINSKFIATKWNAEAEQYLDLKREYAIRAFPTILYFSSTGELLKKHEGFMRTQEALSLNEEVLEFIKKKDIKYKVENVSSLNISETAELLNTLNGFSIDGKQSVLDHLIKLSLNNQTEFDYHLSAICKNVDKNQPLELFEKLINRLPETGSLGVTEGSPEKDKKELFDLYDSYKSLKKALESKNDSYILAKDFKNVKKSAELIDQINGKDTEYNDDDPMKIDYRVKLMEYYNFHKMYDEYASVAKKYLEERLSLNPLSEIKKKDKINLEKLKKDPVRYGIDESQPKHYVLFRSNYYACNCFSALNDISIKYSKMFDDKENLKQALYWSELSTSYMDYPGGYLVTAEILMKLNQNKKALKAIEKGLSSDYIDKIPKIKDALNKIKSELN